MKNLLIPFVLAAALFGGACSNDFEVAAPWKEIPVTYAILSAQGAAQYIRVEKAFLDPEASALVVAKVADSLYYPADAITVFLEKVGTSQKYQLTRVDGNLEGFKRESGIFADSPNWLYKVSTTGADTLVSGAQYKVVIKRADGKPDITATTTVPGDFKYFTPSPIDIPARMSFDTGGVTTFDWRCDVNAYSFNLNAVVRYREEDPTTGQVIAHKSFHWAIAQNVKRDDNPVSSGQFKAKFESGNFFRTLADSIPASNGVLRYFDGLDITLEGGGVEIKEYLISAEANAGITGAEVVAQYTNMSEGFGIFTAKNTLVLPNTRVRPESIENIQKHPLTKLLNFKI